MPPGGPDLLELSDVCPPQNCRVECSAAEVVDRHQVAGGKALREVDRRCGGLAQQERVADARASRSLTERVEPAPCPSRRVRQVYLARLGLTVLSFRLREDRPQDGRDCILDLDGTVAQEEWLRFTEAPLRSPLDALRSQMSLTLCGPPDEQLAALVSQDERRHAHLRSEWRADLEEARALARLSGRGRGERRAEVDREDPALRHQKRSKSPARTRSSLPVRYPRTASRTSGAGSWR